MINYLRKEKEIVGMQLELCKQEDASLKTQIGHLTRSLGDTMAICLTYVCLVTTDSTRNFFLERERAASVAATDTQYAELFEKKPFVQSLIWRLVLYV